MPMLEAYSNEKKLFCIRIRIRGGKYEKIRPYFTVYPNSSPNMGIIPFPNKDSAVAVAAVAKLWFSFGLGYILFGSPFLALICSVAAVSVPAVAVAAVAVALFSSLCQYQCQC